MGVSRTDVHHHGMVHTSTSSGAAVNSEGAPLVSIVSIVSAVSAVSAVSVLGQDGRALEKDQKTQLPSLDDAHDFKTVKLHQVASDPSTFIPTFIKFPIQVPTQMIQKSEDELMSVAQVTTVDFPSRGNNHCTKVETCCALDPRWKPWEKPKSHDFFHQIPGTHGCLWLLSVVFPSNMV